jgi:phosphomevalonate kinase
VLDAVRQEVLRYGLETRGERWSLPPVSVDTSAFRRKGRKLGLGSSAAAAVAACGAWLASQGERLDQNLDVVARLSHAGHRLAQGGRGSGVDVAASVHGGVLRFQKGEPVASVDLPILFLAVVDTGASASTSQLLSAVEELRRHAPALHEEHMQGLVRSASEFVEALAAQDPAAAIQLADDYGRRMAALGESCGCSIVTPILHLIASAARAAGGAAKPSGAGGGDLAVAFFSQAAQQEKFLRECKSHALTSVRLQIGAQGLREESAATFESIVIGNVP